MKKTRLSDFLLEPKISLLVCTLFYAIRLFLSFANPHMPGGVDASTHLFQIWLIASEGLGGWNRWWYAGHPLLVQYPPIPHALGAFLSGFFGIEAAYKLVFAAGFFLLPASFFFLSESFGFGRRQKAVSLYLFSLAPVFEHYLHGGVLSAIFALPFSIFFLAFFLRSLSEKGFRYLAAAAIFLALSFLSHLFIPLAVLLVAAAYVAVFAPFFESAKRLASVCLLCALMVSFFAIPLAFSGAISDPAPSLLSLPLAQLALLAAAPFARSFMPFLNYYSLAMVGLAAILATAASVVLWREGRQKSQNANRQRLVLFSALLFFGFLAWALFLPLAGQAGVKLPLVVPIVFSILVGAAFGRNRLFDLLACALILLMALSFLSAAPSYVPQEARELAKWAAERTASRALLLPQGYFLSSAGEGRTDAASFLYDTYLIPFYGKENYWGWFTEAKPRREWDAGLSFGCSRPRSFQEIISGLSLLGKMTTQVMKECTLGGEEAEFCGKLVQTGADHLFVSKQFPEVIAFAERQQCLVKESEAEKASSYLVLGAKPYAEGDGGQRLPYEKGSGAISVFFSGPMQSVLVRESYFPGWKAWLDGKEVSVEKGGIGFLQLRAGAGEGNHTLVLKYQSENFGGLFYLVSLAAFIVALFAATRKA
ncbi:MAG: hypothetical protein N3E51_04860 [Candidatus Micrarchaeota archaeon]|nr:hypothetical protein [Candidatus Micrarchaeota archaeon]